MEEFHLQRFVIILRDDFIPDIGRTDLISSNALRLIANLETTEISLITKVSLKTLGLTFAIKILLANVQDTGE